MTPADIKRRAEEIEAAYDEAFAALVAEAREQIVLPFCRRHGLIFAAGMGAYTIQKPGKHGSLCHFWRDLLDGAHPGRVPPEGALNFLALGDIDDSSCNNSILTLMEDITEEDLK